MNSYNAFNVGELAPANLTQDNLEQINHADMEEWILSHNDALIKEVTKLKYYNFEFLKNEEIFKKKLDSEKRDISKLKEPLSDKESTYRDAKHRIADIASELDQVKTELSTSKIREENYEYSSNLVAKMIDVEIKGREPTRLGYSEVKPPFNHNYSIMPKINKSIDDLLLKSDRRSYFSYLNRSNDSEVCEEDLSVSGRSEEEEERSVGRSTYCSVPKVDFVGKFETIKIKPNEMIKNFSTNFVKIGDDVKNKRVLESKSSPLTEKVNESHSTIRIEMSSKLNLNYEPYVLTRSLEQLSTCSSPGQSDCDVKPFYPQEFYQKKDTPKAKLVCKPLRTDQSSKPKEKPLERTQNHHTAKSRTWS
ncbi:hypothetical protein R6Q57_010071 [Mikania cordata]